MATYIIQDNIAHFYNTKNVNVWFPKSETVHIEEHPLNLIKSYGVKKVINKPFNLNTEFIKYEEDNASCINEFALVGW
jgi:hypothetical protein